MLLVLIIMIDFYFLTKACEALPTGTVYAIFAGIGTVGTALLDILLFAGSFSIARYRREHYVEPWNPEPLLMERSPDSDPSEVVLQKEGLSIAYLRMMEHLSADERAVLLLRKVLDFSYLEIANIIDKKEENCRKIFSRAKQQLSRVEGESLNYEQNKTIINRFIQAFQMQNTVALLYGIVKHVP